MTSIILSYPQHLDLQGLAETTSQSLALLTPWVLLGESTKNSAVRRVSAAATKYIAAIKLGVSAAYTGFAVTQNIMFLTKSDLMMDEKELQHYLVGMLERARKARGNANKAFEAFREVRQEIFVITQDLQTELQLFGEQDASDEASGLSSITNLPRDLQEAVEVLVLFSQSTSAFASWWDWVMIEADPQIKSKPVEFEFHIDSLRDKEVVKRWGELRLQYTAYVQMVGKIEDANPRLFPLSSSGILSNDLYQQPSRGQTEQAEQRKLACFLSEDNAHSSSAIVLATQESGSQTPKNYFKCLCQSPSGPNVAQPDAGALTTTSSSQLLMTSGARPDQHCTTLSGSTTVKESHAYSSLASGVATQENGSQAPNDFKCLYQSPSDPNAAQPDASALTTTSSSQLIMTSGARPDQHCTTLSGHTTMKGSHAHSSSASGVVTQENKSQTPKDFNCLYQSPSDPNAAQPDAIALTTTSSSQLIMTSGARPEQHCKTLSGSTTVKGSQQATKQGVAPTEPRGFLEGLVKAGWSIKKALEKHTHMWMADAGGDVVCPNPEQAHLTKQGLDQGARQHQSFDTMNVFTGPESYVGYSFPDGRPQIIPGRATTGDKRYVILCKDLSWSSYISASVGSVQILEEKKCLLMLHFQCHPSPTHRFYSLAIKCKFLPIRGMSGALPKVLDIAPRQTIGGNSLERHNIHMGMKADVQALAGPVVIGPEINIEREITKTVSRAMFITRAACGRQRDGAEWTLTENSGVGGGIPAQFCVAMILDYDALFKLELDVVVTQCRTRKRWRFKKDSARDHLVIDVDKIHEDFQEYKPSALWPLWFPLISGEVAGGTTIHLQDAYTR